MISLKLNLQIVRSLQMSPDYTGSPFYPKEPPMYANVCNPWQQEFHFDWCVDYNLEGAFVCFCNLLFFCPSRVKFGPSVSGLPSGKRTHTGSPVARIVWSTMKGKTIENSWSVVASLPLPQDPHAFSMLLNATNSVSKRYAMQSAGTHSFKMLQIFGCSVCEPVGDCEIAKMALWECLRKVSRLAVLHPRPSASHRFMKFCPSNLCCHMLSPHWFVEFQAQGQMGGEAVEMEETPECRVDGMRENQLAWQKYLSTGRDIETWWNMIKHVWMCLCNILYIQISAHPRACGHSLVRTKTQHNAIHLIHSLWHLTGIQSDHFATPCSTKIY